MMLSEIKDALKLAWDGQTLEVVRERLIFAQDQLSVAESKIAALEAENIELLRENRTLRSELEAMRKNPKYLELGICALQPNPAGGYFETPLCPSCKKPLSIFGNDKMACAPCRYVCKLQDVVSAVKRHAAS